MMKYDVLGERDPGNLPEDLSGLFSVLARPCEQQSLDGVDLPATKHRTARPAAKPYSDDLGNPTMPFHGNALSNPSGSGTVDPSGIWSASASLALGPVETLANVKNGLLPRIHDGFLRRRILPNFSEQHLVILRA